MLSPVTALEDPGESVDKMVLNEFSSIGNPINQARSVAMDGLTA
jgi:hypothetical protein